MQVSILLQTKGDQVVTVGPDTVVRDVLQVLVHHRIGAVVVSRDEQTIDGVLSERDVVAALAAYGAAALDQPASSLMTATVITCHPDTTVDQLMATMTQQRVRHVPVVVEGALAGLVSIGDVVKHHIASLEHETQALHDYIAHPY